MWPFTRSPKAPAAVRREPVLKRSYVAAQADRLLADIPTWSRAADADLRAGLKAVRSRARHLADNDDYAKGFLKLARRHVIGPAGLMLQMRVPSERGTGQDVAANDKIEAGWAEWSRFGVPTIDGRYGRADLERMVISTVARDGEVFIRHVENWKGNRFGYAVQLLEADHLDETLNGEGGQAVGTFRIPAGHRLRLGIEQDEAQRAVAYHFRTRHPGEESWSRGADRYTRVPADQVIHAYLPDRLGASRGISWFATPLMRLAMLHGYEKAELVAARIASAKVGFYGASDPEDVSHQGSTAAGLIQDVEPGSFEALPPGVELKPWDPQHPNTAYRDFVKGVLRGAASSLGVAYHSLTGDLESANYSSLRAGLLEDRDEWRTLQAWFIECVERRIFDRWLLWALTTQAVALPTAKIDRFNAPQFVARGWQWVDPAKEIQASREEVDLGITSRTRICAERGVDFEDVLRELQAEKALAKSYGIDLSTAAPKPAAPQPAAPQSDQEAQANAAA